MKELFNNAPVLAALAIPLFMLGNILGGVIESKFETKFDPAILKQSLIKYLGIMAMLVLGYFGGILVEEAFVSAGIDIQIKEIVNTALIAYTTFWALRFAEKLKAVTGVDTVNQDESEEQ